MTIRATDAAQRFTNLCCEIGLSQAVVDCFSARGYTTASALAFSIDSPETLGTRTLGVLRDDDEPDGGVMGNKAPPNRIVLMSVEAGRIRRIHSECKTLCTPAGSSAGPPTCQLALTDIDEGAPPPRLSTEAMNDMIKAYRKHYPSEVLDDDNTP